MKAFSNGAGVRADNVEFVSSPCGSNELSTEHFRHYVSSIKEDFVCIPLAAAVEVFYCIHAKRV